MHLDRGSPILHGPVTVGLVGIHTESHEPDERQKDQEEKRECLVAGEKHEKNDDENTEEDDHCFVELSF